MIYGHDLLKRYVAIISDIRVPNFEEIGRVLSEILRLICFWLISPLPPTLDIGSQNFSKNFDGWHFQYWVKNLVPKSAAVSEL